MTMIAAALAAAQVAAQSATPPPVVAWGDLPVFPLPRAAEVTDNAAAFVRGEVAAGRCRTNQPAPGGTALPVPLAILVGPSGMVRTIVPQAIGCATVEQFTVGYLSSLTRNGPGAVAALRQGWYRITVTYRWP